MTHLIAFWLFFPVKLTGKTVFTTVKECVQAANYMSFQDKGVLRFACVQYEDNK